MQNTTESQPFLPFPFIDVPVTDGHLLHEDILTIIDEVDGVGAPPTASGVPPIKRFLSKIFLSDLFSLILTDSPELKSGSLVSFSPWSGQY